MAHTDINPAQHNLPAKAHFPGNWAQGAAGRVGIPQIPSIPWGHAHGPRCQSPGTEAQGVYSFSSCLCFLLAKPTGQLPCPHPGHQLHPPPIQPWPSFCPAGHTLLPAPLLARCPSCPGQGATSDAPQGAWDSGPTATHPSTTFPYSATSPPATRHLALGCPPTCLPQSPPAAPLPHASGSLTTVPPCPLHLPITPPGSDPDTCQSPAGFHHTLPPSKPLLTADMPALPQLRRAPSTSVL